MIRFQCSTLSKLSKISFLHEAMYIYNKPQDSADEATENAISSILRPEVSNCDHNSNETFSFDDILHLLFEGNFVTYADFDCGITSYPEARTDRLTENGKTFPDLVNKPSASQKTINIVVFFYEEHNSIIFLNPYKL